MPVQDYIGQGFSFDNGEKTGEFAKKHREEIIKVVDQFFKKEYGLEVTTHNLVGAKNAVLVFVESKQEPYFHTSVVVGVNLENNKISDDVFTYEGSVEGAIMSGIYAMAYEKEFKKLDEFCEMIAKKYPVVGMRKEAVEKTMDSGYSTPYYYVNTAKMNFPKVYDAFIKNHQITKDRLLQLINEKAIEDYDVGIALTFYMKKTRSKPDEKLANEVIQKFKQTKEVFPPGSYAIFIKSNEINKSTGIERSNKGTTLGFDDIIVRPE
ncbi:hypothetical protein B5V88_07570 [Heyndrickxia sporothermodurans]|uniref:DUF1672 family protein n=1 Tax=Heyndrickxia sporothermodurans TaxID=46224 RepID=A0AB37HF12_9BACI|nr:DUF1672 family protein [Heyndrickxia sporothermodurans]MBL5768419.1 DUF1672 family protein [Heyndrickxia sporothermodurans]MBL5772068.1 DUF1672 family protein [Heyndrickxia sporothermodurans]MBL5775669.1 DUF1672 family protein [Heyndrickxia sporothermodurans]MBL5779189.1 DUF1672 family protein [Heyndrickxia sporothermodurans]MBL5780678.1 DUF1672 family protein [Heyndrickxia sporothermodurans]